MKPDKDKSHMTLLICGLKNMQMNLFANRNRPTDIENKLMATKRDGGGAGIDCEFGINSYTLLYILIN